MPCLVTRNSNNEIERVETLTGRESILFQDINKVISDKEQALRSHAQIYTPAFTEQFGDWQKPLRIERDDPGMDEVTLNNIKADFEGRVDTNGEPLVSSLTLNVQPAKQDLDKKITNFLTSIGVNVTILDKIRDREGNVIDAVAKADILAKTIELVKDKQDITTLPEEAAHFYVELLGENNPLYESMYNSITSYSIYGEVLREYKDNPLYRNSDGTINFPKIKKEAIGKLIATHILSEEQYGETDKKFVEAQKWWAKVLDFISKLFNKNKEVTNPFGTAARNILTADTSNLSDENLTAQEFLQISTPFEKLLNDQSRITLDDSVDPTTGEKKHIYEIDGKPIVNKDGSSRSVSSVLVQTWYKKKFPIDNRSEAKKNLNALQAEWGTALHEDIQEIFKRMTHPNGSMRDEMLPKGVSKTNPKIYAKLEEYVLSLVSSYEAGTKFIPEVKIFDSIQNLPGSIDLVVQLPDGSIDIYDWKSQDIAKGQTDLKWFKEPAYRIQLGAYKKILQDQYGFTKINKVRAIPMATTFSFTKSAGGFQATGLKDVEIGNVDPNLIPDNKDYLLPVTLEDESTGDAKLDELIEKLNAVLAKATEAKVKPSERDKKILEINKIKKAIRNLQVRQDIASYVENGALESSKYSKRLKEDSLSVGEVRDAISIMKVYAKSALYVQGKLQDLRDAIKASTGPEKERLEKVQTDYLAMSQNAESVLIRLEDKLKEQGEQITQKNGFMNLLKAERPLQFLTKWFRSLSTIPTTAVRVFSSELQTVQDKRDYEDQKLREELSEIHEELTKWASAQGISGLKMFDKILNFDEKGNWDGSFLRKYSKEYWDKKEDALKNNKFKWLRDNQDFDQAKYDKDLASYKEYVDQVPFSTDPVKNQKEKDTAIDNWINRYSNKSKQAFLNPENYYLQPKEKWQSDAFKELYRKDGSGNLVNGPLVKFYEYAQTMLKKSAKLGMTTKFSSGFVPNIYNDKLELAVFGGLAEAFNTKGLFENLEVDSDQGFGKMDPLDGKLLREVPVYFTRDIGVEKADGTMDYSRKSRDLMKVFAIWGQHMHNYEAMNTIKDTAEALMHIEANKKSLITNFAGKVKEGSAPQEGNEVNAKVLEDFVRYYVYGQTLGGDSDISVKIGDKEYSGNKFARKAVSYLSIKTLGLNFLSGTSTFVGGTGNAIFQASKRVHFTEGEWARGIRAFANRDENVLGGIGFFDVLLEDRKRENANELSTNGAVRNLTTDQLFIILRTGDNAVQYPVFATMMATHMVHEGEIVSIRNHVRKLHGYEGIYNLPKSERKALNDKIEAQILDYQNTKSLKATGKIVNGKLEIPGIKRDDPTVLRFRNKVKKITKTLIGNATHDDINLIRTTLFGSILMQFRSWMPQMVTERFGDMVYDKDLDTYQYGRAKVFFGHLLTKQFMPLLAEMAFGFGGNTIERAKEKYHLMKIQMRESGQEFNMTETEYIDMYIGSLRAMMREMIVLLGFFAMVMWAAPGDDDDDEYTGARRFISRALQKYQNEFAFFYSPMEFQEMIKNPVPMMGLLNDVESAVAHSFGQVYGFGLGDEELLKEYKPAKYYMKLIPIMKEGVSMYAMFDDDFRKDWGIRK